MQGWGTNKSPEHEAQDRIIMNGVDRVVPVSHAAEQLLLKKGIKPDLMRVIYNSVGKVPTTNLSGTDWDFIRGLKSKKKIIGCIGTVCARKNQQLLVEAMKILCRERDDLHCIIIGEGDTLGFLRLLVGEEYALAESISFLGYKPNADAFIPLFDLLCLPSRAEGLPLSVLEGFRDGTPVIGSDIPEIKEIISARENGFLFESDNAESLANTITSALVQQDDQRQSLINKAYGLYREKFRFEVMAGKYDLLYHEHLNI